MDETNIELEKHWLGQTAKGKTMSQKNIKWDKNIIRQILSEANIKWDKYQVNQILSIIKLNKNLVRQILSDTHQLGQTPCRTHANLNKHQVQQTQSRTNTK